MTFLDPLPLVSAMYFELDLFKGSFSILRCGNPPATVDATIPLKVIQY